MQTHHRATSLSTPCARRVLCSGTHNPPFHVQGFCIQVHGSNTVGKHVCQAFCSWLASVHFSLAPLHCELGPKRNSTFSQCAWHAVPAIWHQILRVSARSDAFWDHCKSVEQGDIILRCETVPGHAHHTERCDKLHAHACMTSAA